jgi:3-oxoacyl-[acyl-carrier protein] reductase
MKKAIVLAGSRGIGGAIAAELKKLGLEVVATSSRELDTSNIEQIKRFIQRERDTDVLVLNTGGPPAKDISDIAEEDWNQAYRQLFLGFSLILQSLKVRRGGYVFLISSFNINEPDPKLILSNSFRIAFVSVLKSLSKQLAQEQISCINISPGPIKTDRLYSLVSDMEAFEKTLPMQRAGRPEEIGRFVRSIIENDIKYLSGVSINFDGASSRYVLT